MINEYAYLYLTVHSVNEVTCAVLLVPRLLGQEYREGLVQDFQRLSDLDTTVVRLDLRALDFIDAFFPGQLIVLSRALKQRGARLVVEPSANLAELFRITHLDRVFEVDS